MKISIITVSFHTGETLWTSLAAALAQGDGVELVVVNNGNPPEVENRLAGMAAADPAIKFVTGHGNVGFGRGCNLGAKAAAGEYLLFLNPDCAMDKEAVAALLSHVAQLKRPFMMGARLLGEDGRDQRGCRRALLTPTTAAVEALGLHRLFPRLRLNRHEEPVPSAISPVPAISGAFMFLAAKDFWSIGGFDEGYFLHVEDLDLCLRFRRAGGEIYFAPDVRAVHVGGTSDTTSRFLEINKAKGFIRYFHNNFSRWWNLPLLWLLDLAILARLGVKLLASRR